MTCEWAFVFAMSRIIMALNCIIQLDDQILIKTFTIAWIFG